ncbi:MAG: O-antigen ligase family protein [Eubacteriales bacterium]|nr:O-antigen ligase family protein [Eubacteriales bacterium]
MEKFRDIFTDTSLFRRCYIFCSFFIHISFVQIPAYVLLVFLFLWGIFLLIYNQIKRKTISNTRFGFWLVAFLITTTITMLLHIGDNFLFNLIIQLHVSICFFILYGLHTEKHLNFRRELYTICEFVVYTTTIVGVIGLAFLMAGISFEVESIKFIIYENRFTGFYSNPNALGFICVVAMLCIHMLTKINFIDLSGKTRVSRIWLLTCLLVNGVSLFLCDSNGAIMLMVCYVIVFVLFKMFGAEHGYNKKQVMLRMGACAVAGLFIVGTFFVVRDICQTGFVEVISAVEGSSGVTEEVDNDSMIDSTGRVTFTHENKNIDSGRFKLWDQAVQMFCDHPVFGIGRGNIYDYGAEKFEKGIHLSHLYGDTLAAYTTDFHNGYLTLLVCAGAVGFLIFVVFGFIFAKHITVYVFKSKNLNDSILPCLFSFLCAYLVYSFIEKTLIYDVSFRVMFFWLILGYVGCFLRMYEPDTNSTVSIFKKKIKKTFLW